MGVVMIHEAKARLSELIDRALRGEEVIIARRKTPLIRLVPFNEGPSTRKIGTAKGRVRIHDDFDILPTEFDEYTVRVILDTNVFLWIISDDQRLSAAARETYLDDDTIPFLSMASIGEMMFKSSIGKLELPPRPGQLIEEQLRLTACTILDITIEHCTAVVSLPFHHGDPFDRLIIAQSLVERVPVLSGDSLWDEYGVTNHF